MMKSSTYILLFILSFIVSSCSRNPLGEDLAQPILNFNFVLTHACTTTFNQDAAFNCQVATNEPMPNLVWSLEPTTTCAWANINSSTGVITGTPNDDQVGACSLSVKAVSAEHISNPFSIPITVSNLPATFTVANASAINEDASATVIRNDVDVQASEEGFGIYSLSNSTATVPRCSDNAASLTINSTTGAITYAPALNYNGTCNIRVAFNDGNGAANSIVYSQFSITVNPVNDAPVLAAIPTQNTTEDIPIVVNYNITDVDNTLDCITSVTATSSNVALVPNANIVLGGTAPNCTATITPLLNQTGVTNITLDVTDGVLTDTKSFVLNVNAFNDPPVLAAISNQIGFEDTPIIFNINVSDVDTVLGCNSTYLSATSSNTALLTSGNITYSGIPPLCTVTLNPTANANGSTNIVMSLTDGANVVTQAFTATFSAINDAPVMSNISSQTTNEDTTLVINFTITDIDSTLNCATSISRLSANTTLIPTANIVFAGTAPNCSATVTPALNQFGSTNLTFTVTDSGGLTDTKVFSFTVNPVNDAPVISPMSSQTMNEDSVLGINFTITDVDSTLSCATSVTAASSNTGLINTAGMVFSGTAPNCTVTLTPLANANGTSNITLTVSDGALTQNQSFLLTVNGVNDAPVLSAISNQTTNEDVSVVVNFTMTDIDNTLNCATSITASSSDTVLMPVGNIVFSGVAPNCTATLTSALNQFGNVNLTFTLSDGALTSVQNFSLAVSAVNDAPVLSTISNQTTSEDVPVVINFTITDVESSLNCVTSLSATSSNTTLLPLANIVFGGTAPNCTATLTPTSALSGVSNVNFTVTDGLLTDVKSFSFTVLSVNDAPVLSSISNQTTNEDTAVVINYTITDVDSILTCTNVNLSATSSNTTLVPVANIVYGGVAPNCTATITPAANQNGTTNLTLTVDDLGTPSLQDSKSFTLTVNPINDAPVLSAISNQIVNEDSNVVVNFTIIDVDDVLSCATSMTMSSSQTSIVSNGNVVFSGVAPNCTATISPIANQSGVLNLTFRVTDGSAAFQDQTFQLTVNAVNDAPIISAISNQATNEDTPIVVNFTITDVDNTLNCATSVSATSSNTTLLPMLNIVFGGTAPNCTATLTSTTNASGISNLVFTASDGALTATSSFSLTVTAVNDAPIISSIANQIMSEDNSLAVNFTITDVDSTLNCATSVSAGSSNTALITSGSVVFTGTAPNCTATLTPLANQSGSATLTFTVSDTALTDAKSFLLTVNGTNDPPVISVIADQTIAEDGNVVVNFTITDPDSTLNCATSVSASSSDTVLLPISNIVFGGVAPNCTATLSPALNQNGNSNLIFTVSDGALTANSGFMLTVTPVNDAPTMSAISNQSTTEDTPIVLNFTINDVDNVLDCATSVLVTSSNNTLLPAASSFAFSGTAPNCTVTMTPGLNRSGSSNVVFYVSDGVALANRSFTVTVSAVNDAPVISAISAQNTNESTAIAINFTISDVDNVLSCSSTYLSMTSSNTTLVPVSNVVWSGTAPNCTATVTPAGINNGTSNLAFVLSDGSLTATSSFVLTVNSVNEAPTISSISSQTIYEGRPQTINFTINDNDGPLVCSTSLSASSSNTTLLPVSNIVFSGTYPNCVATLSLAAGQNGTSNVSITVSDTLLTNSSAFVVTGHKISSVALSPLTPILPKNSNTSFTLTATYSDATSRNLTTSATWATSNATYTSFISNGVLNNTYSGTSVVTSTITATYGSFSANTVATINPATITSLMVTASSATMNIGNTLQLKCYGITSDGGLVELTQSCSWTSANTTIVTVDNTMDKGLVTAVNLGSATNVTATYSSYSASSAITVDVTAPTQADDGTGLTANYYLGTNYTTLTNTRVDATVNFNWAAGNNPAGSADSFSVRWTGYIKAPTTGTYTFYTNSDDGVRLYVNGSNLVNNWTNHGAIENSGTISLIAGVKYSVTLEFYENSGSAVIQLSYSGPSVSKQIIPQIQLYPQ